MRTGFFLALTGCWFCAASGYLPADEITLPMPRTWYDDACKPLSGSEFEQQLQQLKAERTALIAEWKALVKRSAVAVPPAESEMHLQMQLKDVLKRLQQSRLAAETPPRPPDQLDVGKLTELARPGEKKTPESAPPPKEEIEPTDGPIDALAKAHTLFRAHQYDEALASFRLLDLKGKKAEARAPVQYLMALCLLHLGKTDEALPLLRDVANARGDEVLASYAQWQLEMFRWQRGVRDRLGEFRGRRLAVEKRI